MAWEARGHAGSLFYYRCKRTSDGKVRKEYLGRGPRAQRVAQAAAQARRRAEEERRALADEKARLASIDAVTKDVSDTARLLNGAILLANNYHRPNYGQWRRRHVD
jgi:hypothetical protein